MALKNRQFGQWFLAFHDNQLCMYVDGEIYVYLNVSKKHVSTGTNSMVYSDTFKKEIDLKWLLLHGYDKKILDKMQEMGYNRLKKEVSSE